MVQKIYSNIHLVSCTHHDVTDLVNHEMVKNAKNLNNLKTEYNFSAKILNLCLKWHILSFCSFGSCHFVAEVTFKYHNQRMERIEFPDAWLYAESFATKVIKIKYSGSSLDHGNFRCNHQQPYNFFLLFADFCTTQENQNWSIQSRRISCNWEKKISIISKGKIFGADRKKSLYC